jgi:hypothetical protein
MERVGYDANTVDLARYRAQRMRERLLRVVNGILVAIERRDLERVLDLLDDPEAYRCIPARVRQEAIAVAQLPEGSLRAPIRLYRYQYLLFRHSDDPLESPLDPSQFALMFASAPAPRPMRAKPTPVRELSFADRPVRERRTGGRLRRARARRRTLAR